MALSKDRRKILQEQYKNRKVIGGVYIVRNKKNGRYFMKSTDDLQGTRNWYESCLMFDNCSLPPVAEEWKTYGQEAFCLEILEELEKKEVQTRAEFLEDLKILLEYWREQMDPALSY